jgi:diguanylate cyclase (GGDEF)-like protein
MLVKERREPGARRAPRLVNTETTRPLALFTESLVALLSSPGIHKAYMDLIALMGQTFPLAAPALYLAVNGIESRVYSVLEPAEGGEHDAHRVLGPDGFTYIRVVVGGHPPIPYHRVDLPLVNTTQATATLSINRGMHEEIFREWVKILAPAVAKLIDNEQLKALVFRDGLTGALNYRAFEEMLTQEWERANRYKTAFSLMMIDLDHFKSINDRFGHPVGDMVLRTVAQTLEKCVRKSDRVFRYGGEEFSVLMPHTDIGHAGLLAQRIRQTVAAMRIMPGLRLTVSLGLSQYQDGLQAGDLVKNADMGLYKAKAGGRNRVEIVKDGQ